MGLTIDIAVRHDAWRTLPGIGDLVDRAAAAATSVADATVPEGTEFSLVLCDDAFIRELNRTWRGKDMATNVLSFPADPSARHATLGDVIIAYETTAREATREGRPMADHFAHLVMHGLLHLLGFDHENDSEAEIMEGLEVEALQTIGIASPYEDAASPRVDR